MNGVGQDPLEAKLSEALRTGLADSPVDTPGLLEGAHQQVRRVRRRRVAGVGVAAALVLAVPVGYEVVHPKPSDYGTQATMLPAPSSRAPSPVATLPDSLAFSTAELPAGLSLDLSLVSDRVPVVSGQQCGAGAGPRPRTGRQWNWSNGSSDATAVSVNLIVTRWADPSAAFADLVAGTGPCRWVSGPARREFSAAGASSSWAGTSEFSTLHYGRAVVRVGDLIAGVEVQTPAGTTEALATAERLATTLTPRLK